MRGFPQGVVLPSRSTGMRHARTTVAISSSEGVLNKTSIFTHLCNIPSIIYSHMTPRVLVAVASAFFLTSRVQAAPTQNAQPWSNTTFRATAYSGPPRPFPPDPKVAKVDFLGDVHSSNTYVIRDLGFQGRLGDHILLSYGDTLFSDANYSDTWRGIASDSIALATHDPLVVIDPILDDNGYPPQFCPIHKQYGEDNSECALGITNVVETSHNQGILFFLLNHRPGGVSRIVGAGVATVHLDTRSYPPKPHINRLPPQTWWDGDTEPWWGDVGALRWGEHIYAYGHGSDKDTNPWVYVTRVKYYEATNINCYEYWNGDTWQKERLKGKDLGEKGSVFWQINQGTVVWSNYFHCFIFVYSGKSAIPLDILLLGHPYAISRHASR